MVNETETLKIRQSNPKTNLLDKPVCWISSQDWRTPEQHWHSRARSFPLLELSGLLPSTSSPQSVWTGPCHTWWQLELQVHLSDLAVQIQTCTGCLPVCRSPEWEDWSYFCVGRLVDVTCGKNVVSSFLSIHSYLYIHLFIIWINTGLFA